MRAADGDRGLDVVGVARRDDTERHAAVVGGVGGPHRPRGGVEPDGSGHGARQRLLQVGDVVDLVAADPQAGTAETVATDVVVLTIPAADEASGPTGLPGRLVVAGVADADVPAVADAVSRLLVTYVWSTH